MTLAIFVFRFGFVFAVVFSGRCVFDCDTSDFHWIYYVHVVDSIMLWFRFVIRAAEQRAKCWLLYARICVTYFRRKIVCTFGNKNLRPDMVYKWKCECEWDRPNDDFWIVKLNAKQLRHWWFPQLKHYYLFISDDCRWSLTRRLKFMDYTSTIHTANAYPYVTQAPCPRPIGLIISIWERKSYSDS